MFLQYQSKPVKAVCKSMRTQTGTAKSQFGMLLMMPICPNVNRYYKQGSSCSFLSSVRGGGPQCQTLKTSDLNLSFGSMMLSCYSKFGWKLWHYWTKVDFVSTICHCITWECCGIYIILYSVVWSQGLAKIHGVTMWCNYDKKRNVFSGSDQWRW